jgi:hypothetical protein
MFFLRRSKKLALTTQNTQFTPHKQNMRKRLLQRSLGLNPKRKCPVKMCRNGETFPLFAETIHKIRRNRRMRSANSALCDTRAILPYFCHVYIGFMSELFNLRRLFHDFLGFF